MKRKMKKRPIFILIFIIIFIIVVISFIVRTINYHKTYDYKLGKQGFNKEEIVELKKLKDDTLNYLLTITYNKDIVNIIKEKYFLEKNLSKYITYLEKNKDKDISDIISIVNVGADNDFYTNTKKTDTNKGILMLTNKYYGLDETYDDTTMKEISSTYSYGSDQMLVPEALNAFINMFKAAKKENLTLIINSSYRSYKDQDEVYNKYKDTKGEEYADSIAARPGYSEHQTGLAIDIQTYGSRAATFEEFDEFKWLQNNAHKYGIILRYPKDKEYLTGYSYESWHYRYVGISAATYIKENNITFDEYYAYFIEGKENEKETTKN